MIVLYVLLGIAGFVLFWMAVTALISLISGWYGLAKSHPVPPRLYEKGATFSFQSMRLGLFGNYNSVLNITVYSGGIRIAPLAIYSVLHKPIFIEFKSMADVSFGKFIFPFIAFTLGSKKIRIWGKCVSVIKEQIDKEPRS